MMKWVKKILLFLFLVVLCVVMAIITEPMPDHPFHQKQGVEVIAHRGGWRLWPENTLYAFQRSVDLGVDMLEMDVQLSKDGHLVVFHDNRVNRTTNDTGYVHTFTLAELKALDAGYKWSSDKKKTFPFRGKGIVVPTLKEVFEAFPQMRMVIEIKERKADLVAPLGNLIRQYDMQDKVLIASFDAGVLKRFRAQFPEVATSPGLSEGFIFYMLCRLSLSAVYHPNAEVLQIPYKFGPFDTKHPWFIEGAKQNNIQIQFWTVDAEEDLALLIERGVDGIITRRPDRLLKLLGRGEKNKNE